MHGLSQVRSFNRAVTHRIGALEDGFLGRNRSLGACRLLFEIGIDGLEIRRLRARLGLDSGYLSRLLRELEAEGLIRTTRSPADSRVRFAAPTAAGRRELAVLDRLSDDAAAALLDPLVDSDRATLLAAMGTVERLLRRAAVRVAVADPTDPAARDCVDRYFAELSARFDRGFDPGRSISADAEELVPPRGYFLLATLDGEPVGCGALKCHPGFGEIKRMWVTPSARGVGVGTRILQRLESIARERRLPLLRLETNRSLVEAHSLYRRAGFREVPAFNDEPYAHHWFEKTLDSGSRVPAR